MYSGIAAFKGIKEWLELPGQSNLKIAPSLLPADMAELVLLRVVSLYLIFLNLYSEFYGAFFSVINVTSYKKYGKNEYFYLIPILEV